MLTDNGDGSPRRIETPIQFGIENLPDGRVLLKAHLPVPDIKIFMNVHATTHPVGILLAMLGWVYGNARAFAANEEMKRDMPAHEHEELVGLSERIVAFVDAERPQ